MIYYTLRLNAVGENIIGAPKIRNNYGAIYFYIFPILRYQYWIFLYFVKLSLALFFDKFWYS